VDDRPGDLLRRAEEMEQTLLALHQDGAARILRELRLHLASQDGAEEVAAAARRLVEDAGRHALARGGKDDDLDLDDDLWAALVAAVEAWRRSLAASRD